MKPTDSSGQLADQIYILEYGKGLVAASEFEIQQFALYYGIRVLIQREGIAVVQGYSDGLRDSAFVNRISKVLRTAPFPEELGKTPIPSGRFYVRFRDLEKCHASTDIEPRIGNLLDSKGRIDFSNPDFIVRVYHLDGWYLAIETFSRQVREFDQRRAPNRPFFSPISMHPQIARFLVNVSGALQGTTILDPFCGTGGILIEAALTRHNVLGVDRSIQMTAGAKLNLKYYGVNNSRIITGDFLETVIDDTVDAIVTDLPYGRNAPIYSQEIGELYRMSFEKFAQILKEGRRCVIAISDPSLLGAASNSFRTLKIIDHRIHGSLTRHYVILERKAHA